MQNSIVKNRVHWNETKLTLGKRSEEIKFAFIEIFIKV